MSDAGTQLVSPGALCSAGGSLEAVASSLSEVTGVVASLDAAAAAIKDPHAAGCYERMQRVWRAQLAALAEQTGGLGGDLQSGAGCYVGTDEGVMQGGGGPQRLLLGPLLGPPAGGG
jgi:hypothetical protein